MFGRNRNLKAVLAGIARARHKTVVRADAARASLVTIVSHELRTPLAVVRASLELIGAAGGGANAGETAHWETEALHQVDRLDSMVDSILASLRVLREEPQHLEPIDVAAVVDSIFERLGSILRRHQLEASFDARHEPFRSELAVTMAASMANSVFLMGQQVGLVTNGRDAADRIRQQGWDFDIRTRDAAQRARRAPTRADCATPLPANKGCCSV